MIVLHRGKCGDLIALCAWLKQRHSDQKAHIYIKQHRSFQKQNVDWIAPLLLNQPYIEKVGICQKLSDVEPVNDIPCNLKAARQQALKNHSYTGWWVDQPSWWAFVGAVRNQTDLRDRIPLAYNQPIQSKQPWLQVPASQRLIKEPYIIISVTPRYGCLKDFSCLRKLQSKYKIIFLGHQHNWLTFAPWANYAQCSAIQTAQLIRDCELYAGTQTLHTWLAQALGKDRIVAVSPRFKDTTFRVEKGFKASVNSAQELQGALNWWSLRSFHN